MNTIKEDSFIYIFGSTTLINHSAGLSNSSWITSLNINFFFGNILRYRNLNSFDTLDSSDVRISQKLNNFNGCSVVLSNWLHSENLVSKFHNVFVSSSYSVNHVSQKLSCGIYTRFWFTLCEPGSNGYSCYLSIFVSGCQQLNRSSSERFD